MGKPPKYGKKCLNPLVHYPFSLSKKSILWYLLLYTIAKDTQMFSATWGWLRTHQNGMVWASFCSAKGPAVVANGFSDLLSRFKASSKVMVPVPNDSMCEFCIPYKWFDCIFIGWYVFGLARNSGTTKIHGHVGSKWTDRLTNRSVRCAWTDRFGVCAQLSRWRWIWQTKTAHSLMKDCTVEDVRRSWNTDSMIHVYIICPRTARFKMLVSRSGKNTNASQGPPPIRSDPPAFRHNGHQKCSGLQGMWLYVLLLGCRIPFFRCRSDADPA